MIEIASTVIEGEMLKRCWGVVETARRCHISPSRISRLLASENGVAHVRLTTVSKLAGGLGVGIGDLLANCRVQDGKIEIAPWAMD